MAGCSSSVDADTVRSAGGPVAGVAVAGPGGEAPDVRVVTPLKLDATRSRVVVDGTGAPVQADQLVVLELTLVNGRTGEQIVSTYDDGQAPVVAKSSDDTLFPALIEKLVGLHQGDRLVMALTGADAYGTAPAPPAGVEPGDPIVLVADVVAVPPTEVLPAADGAVQTPLAGSPTVVVEDGMPVRIDVAGATEPGSVVVIPLLVGTGPEVRDGSLVTIDHLSQGWGARIPYDDTYLKEPVVVPVGTAGAVPAWSEALVGLRRGSRVLVIAPREQAREPVSSSLPDRATIAWVIDILGVS